MDIRVAQLYYYPVKSCGGVSCEEVLVDRSGIRYDREWMVVDHNGVFVAQRGGSSHRGIGVRQLCRVQAGIQAERLVLQAPSMRPLRIPLDTPASPRSVRIWSRHEQANDQGDEAAQWFTEYISQFRKGEYRLVRIQRDKPESMAFFDDAEIHVISQSSLDDLNRRTPEPIPMDQFRPCIVLRGTPPYWEDQAKSLAGEEVELEGAGLCSRCTITMTNQSTGSISKEPLRTLATYRRTAKGVAFGRYFAPKRTGRIRRGESLQGG